MCSGDVLLSINGQDLTSLSHSDAVGTLKSSAASCSVQLRALEVSTVDEPGQDEGLLPHHESDYDASWSPSWVMWLGLPRWGSSSFWFNEGMRCEISWELLKKWRRWIVLLLAHLVPKAQKTQIQSVSIFGAVTIVLLGWFKNSYLASVSSDPNNNDTRESDVAESHECAGC